MPIHAGDARTAKKLKALAIAMGDGKWHTARELRVKTKGLVEAVSARIQELKAQPNDFHIQRKHENGNHYYMMRFPYSTMLWIKKGGKR